MFESNNPAGESLGDHDGDGEAGDRAQRVLHVTDGTVHLEVTGRLGRGDLVGRRLLLVGIRVLRQVSIRRRRVRHRARDAFRIELVLALGGQCLGTRLDALVIVVEVLGGALDCYSALVSSCRSIWTESSTFNNSSHPCCGFRRLCLPRQK